MILVCDRDVMIHARDARERVCLALAHALYERLAAEGDSCVALLAMGELYAVLTLPLRQVSLSVRGAAEILTTDSGSAPGAARDGSDRLIDGSGESTPASGTNPRPSVDVERLSPFPDALLLAAANRIGCAVSDRRQRSLERRDEIDDVVALFEGRTLDSRLGALLV